MKLTDLEVGAHRATRERDTDSPLNPGGEAGGTRFTESAAAMRRSGYAVVDAIVERWSNLSEQPVWQGGNSAPTRSLPQEPPGEAGRDLDELLDAAINKILPRAARIDHPRFLAFIPSSPTWASVLGSFLVSGYNVFQGTWLEAAGPSELEVTVLDWFRQWVGFPSEGGGLLTSGGSAANLVAIVAAREAAGNPDQGILYTSDQTHSSIMRGARIAGIDPGRVRLLPSDADFRMVPESLTRAIARDRDAGLHPFCLVANAGATNTGAIDPLRECARIAKTEGLWLHIDGAYGGFAILDAESRARMTGIESADSVTLVPHKWLFQPYETGALVARDASLLTHAFRVMPDYLQDADPGPGEVNFCDRGLQLTRSFRALHIWLSLQRYGLTAHRNAIARAIGLARQAEQWVQDEAALELLAPQSLSILCFRYRGRTRSERELNDLNRRIQDEIVASGLAMISSTRIRGAFSLRLCILNYRTTANDVRWVLEEIVTTGERLEEG